MSGAEPVVVVRRGRPRPEELVALTTVLLALSRSGHGEDIVPVPPAVAWCRTDGSHRPALSWPAASAPAWRTLT
ncbi:acyl-CoA carboxylase epsilon subunit [Streptomyces africanus]|uniref:acyl-CoA carboxylase epsilon subunit n=1 Tax=Streptomyces africanus TaxID=231024 RepID=UPI003522E497